MLKYNGSTRAFPFQNTLPSQSDVPCYCWGHGHSGWDDIIVGTLYIHGVPKDVNLKGSEWCYLNAIIK